MNNFVTGNYGNTPPTQPSLSEMVSQKMIMKKLSKHIEATNKYFAMLKNCMEGSDFMSPTIQSPAQSPSPSPPRLLSDQNMQRLEISCNPETKIDDQKYT